MVTVKEITEGYCYGCGRFLPLDKRTTMCAGCLLAWQKTEAAKDHDGGNPL